jgi:hypothetical protein
MFGKGERYGGLAHARRQAQNGSFTRSAILTSTTSEFRQLFLIYCLDRLPDGSYVALNRRYKPVGFNSTELVKYEDFPVGFKFKRALSAKQIAAISYKGDTSPDRIYLYNDGCIPTASAKDWAAYAERLERLAGCKVNH